MAITIDPALVEWVDLCILVAARTTHEGFQRWAFMVGTDGKPEERLHRGRMVWTLCGESAQEQTND